jgi:arylsulfate sulfotransferase
MLKHSMQFSAVCAVVLMLFCGCQQKIDIRSYYSITVHDHPEPGLIVTTFNRDYHSTSDYSISALAIIDEQGRLLKSKVFPTDVYCLRRWGSGPNVRYTYMRNDLTAYHIPVINQSAGYFVIADSNLNRIRKVRMLPYKDITTEKREGLDLHDFIYFSDDHYLILIYYEKEVTNIPRNVVPSGKADVVACVLQEIDHNKVIWQWDATDYPELYGLSHHDNDFASGKPCDYMHVNSMIIDPRDSSLIVSYRNANQILKIDRKTGNIVWRLGGDNSDYKLDTNQVFLLQHDVTLVDSNQTYLLFDNGGEKKRPYSRILEMRLDEANKKVTSFKAFNIPEPFSKLMGCVQKHGDNYFICGGTGSYLLEINYKTGKKIFELLTNQKWCYRAYKYYN